MSSRIATGPIGVSDSIRARIRTDPSLLEEGLRFLGHDLQAGEAGSVDAIAVDRDGRLVIVSIAPPDIDRAIARLLDLKTWSTDQRDLLGRLYAAEGVAIDRPARFVLLVPALPHALVRRLALLPIEVALLLARPVSLEDGIRIVIEPASSILGWATAAAPAGPARQVASTEAAAATQPAIETRPTTRPAAATEPSTATQPAIVTPPAMATPPAAQPETAARTAAPPETAAQPSTARTAPATGATRKPNRRETRTPAARGTAFWPDEVLPPEYDEKAVPIPATMELIEEEPAWPGSPDDRFPWELPEDPLAPLDEPVAPPEATEAVFETLTAEEMQEFARFDKQRRDRDGRSS